MTVTLDTTPPHVTITSPADQFVTTEDSIADRRHHQRHRRRHGERRAGAGDGERRQPRRWRTGRSSATNVPLALGPNIIQAVGRDRVGNTGDDADHRRTRQAATQPRIRAGLGEQPDRSRSASLLPRRWWSQLRRCGGQSGAEQAGHLQGDAERRRCVRRRQHPAPTVDRDDRRAGPGARRNGRSGIGPAPAATRRGVRGRLRGHGDLHRQRHARAARQDRRRHRQRSDRRDRPAAAEAVHRRRRRRGQQPARRRAGDVHGRAGRRQLRRPAERHGDHATPTAAWPRR